MRNFADSRRLVLGCLCLVVALAVSSVRAQETPASGLFDDARALETALRKEIGTFRSGSPSMPLVRRARILVGTYEDIARLFPESGFGDKALSQGAALAADVFDVFKDPADHAAATRLTDALQDRYPSSALRTQAQRRIGTLAPPVASAAPPASQTAPAQPAAGAAASPTASPVKTAARPVPSQPSSSLLRSIHREVLPDVLRVSLELEREVPFHEERIDGPPRVFVDLQNARAATDIQDARLAFEDDVVRQIRVGRQIDRRIRVVLDLDNAPAHSVYTLYNPFRIVIDFERPRAGVVAPAVVPRAIVAAPAPAESPVSAPAVVTEPARTASPPPATRADAPAARIAPPRTPVPPAPPVAAPRETPSSPAPRLEPPVKNAGGFSVSRQLGLGIARVVIDPGHGGHDPGAKQDSLIESELVLDVALRLEQLLQKDDIEVVLTRRSNVYVPLEERPAIALREQADLYLSIHANASADRRVRGVETYILNFAPNTQSAEVAARENMGSTRTMRSLPDIVKSIALNNKIDESRDLAKQVQASLIEKLSKGNRTVRNLGVKQAPFAVLVGADMPSILAEIGFITNRQDAALVKTAVYRQQIAEAFAAGIARYQKRLKPSQVATTR